MTALHEATSHEDFADEDGDKRQQQQVPEFDSRRLGFQGFEEFFRSLDAVQSFFVGQFCPEFVSERREFRLGAVKVDDKELVVGSSCR